jgi:hypothetical protein
MRTILGELTGGKYTLLPVMLASATVAIVGVVLLGDGLLTSLTAITAQRASTSVTDPVRAQIEKGNGPCVGSA